MIRYRCPICQAACSELTSIDPSHCKSCQGISPAERFWSKVNKDGPVIRPDLGPCWIWTGAVFNHGYGQSYFQGDRLAHRIAYKLSIDPTVSSKAHIDHRCRNILCCNPSHLRATTPKQNGENKPAASKNKSGHRGVYPRGNKWAAYVEHHGKSIYAGLYQTIEAAAEAAKEKRNQLYTHNDFDRLQHVQ